MQIAVIGGGIIGVCTAYFLAVAGHEVSVIEQHGSVGSGASFGNAGLFPAGSIVPWAIPGQSFGLLSSIFGKEKNFPLYSTREAGLSRWLNLWKKECQPANFRINKIHLEELSGYSRLLMQQLSRHHQIDYGAQTGYLQLFRTPEDFEKIKPTLAILEETGVPYKLLNAESARLVEPSLDAETPLAQAVYLPEESHGNPALFTKYLRYAAQTIGVQFHFGQTVQTIESRLNSLTLRTADKNFTPEAVVIATGTNNQAFLKQLALKLPLYQLHGYSITLPLKNTEAAPITACLDEAQNATITRIGNRLRVAGFAHLGDTTAELEHHAFKTLNLIGSQWFPDAARYELVNFWQGDCALLPDSLPVLGATPLKNVFLNMGHGLNGCALAAGSGKILADMLSGQSPEIDTSALTMARYL